MIPSPSAPRTAADASERADWRRVQELHRQLLRVIERGAEEIDRHLRGTLAESLGRVLAHYEGEEALFINDLLALWALDTGIANNADGFRSLYEHEQLSRYRLYNPQEGRRLPTPFEAAVETARRLSHLNQIEISLRTDLPCAAVLGGSLSYGRFYNVRGAAKEDLSSDTDLLLVIPSFEFLPRAAETLARFEGADELSADRLLQRANYFDEHREADKPLVFSHKLRFWNGKADPFLAPHDIPGGYSLSLHIVDREVFDYIILRDLAILEDGLTREIGDYRDSKPAREVDVQRSFSGQEREIPLDVKEVEGGFRSEVRVCDVTEDRFFPGLHQNLVLPQFEVRWDERDLPLRLRVLSFRWKVHERLREERRERQFELQTLSSSHTRHFNFAPHIELRANRGTEL